MLCTVHEYIKQPTKHQQTRVKNTCMSGEKQKNLSDYTGSTVICDHLHSQSIHTQLIIIFYLHPHLELFLVFPAGGSKSPSSQFDWASLYDQNGKDWWETSTVIDIPLTASLFALQLVAMAIVKWRSVRPKKSPTLLVNFINPRNEW